MRHLMLKTCVAGAFALGFIALGDPAKAFSPPALEEIPPLVIHVEDMEDEAVDEDLESGIYPPGSGEDAEDETGDKEEAGDEEKEE